MSNPHDARIKAENVALRAVDARIKSETVVPPQVPDAATLGERLAVHKKDSGAENRKKWQESLAGTCNQVEQVRRNPTLNPSQKLLGIDEAVRGQIDRLLAECEEEGAVIDTFQRSVDAGIDAALTAPPATALVLPEYRAVLLGMTEDERHAFIERLQGTRHDAALRYAIASVPHELSGVSFGIHKQMVDTSLALKDPALLTRPQDLVKRRAALAEAVDGIKRTAAELVDGEAASLLRALVSGNDVP